MRSLRRALLATTVIAALAAPLAAPADPIEITPFGTLELSNVVRPNGATPGTAKLTIKNGSRDGGTVYFGFRIMGTEDIEMTGFSLPTNPSGAGKCIVSDFAGKNTENGWQGAPVFSAGAEPVGTVNSHMRMVGGFLKPSCGDVVVNIRFRTLPLVAYYAAFFSTNAAPWHDNYDEAPWAVAPTGGNADYNEWWNIWGAFDTLGYSNAVTYTG